MGDFNLDLFQYNHHVPTQECIDNLFSHAFLPLISNPTRLTSYSATLINNIFTNNLAHNVLVALFLMIYLTSYLFLNILTTQP